VISRVSRSLDLVEMSLLTELGDFLFWMLQRYRAYGALDGQTGYLDATLVWVSGNGISNLKFERGMIGAFSRVRVRILNLGGAAVPACRGRICFAGIMGYRKTNEPNYPSPLVPLPFRRSEGERGLRPWSKENVSWQKQLFDGAN